MEFLQVNIGNIAVGGIVFAALAAVAGRLIYNFRKGNGGCGCAGGAAGCPGCAKR